MFNKDSLRLIKKTFNRFFSLVMIVLIGTAFMMGLMSNDQVLSVSMDNFNDKYSLQDYQLYSSYGFDQDDVDELKKQSFVEDVFASKMIDAYMERESGGNSYVTRIEEIDRDVNQFELTDGRLPRKDNELLLLISGVSSESFPLGTKLKFYLEDSDLSETLSCTEYTIVGYAKSPAYTSKVLGTSTLKNQDLDMVVYVPSSNFTADYYTTIYFTVNGASELASFSTQYDEFIDEISDEVKAFAQSQQEKRKTKIVEEYKEEIAENEAKLIEEKEKGQKELDDAKALLDESNIKLLVGQMEIDTNMSTLEASESSIAEAEKLLNENETKLNDAKAQVEAADAEGRSFEEIYVAVSAAYVSYTALEGAKDMGIAIEFLPDEVKKYIDADNFDQSIEDTLKSIDEQCNGSVKETYAQLTMIKEGLQQIEDGREEIEEGKVQIEEGKAQLEAAQATIDSGKYQYEEGLKEYEEGLKTFNDEIEKAETEIKKAYQDLDELPSASWTILDRDSHYSSYMFKNTCSQMKAIGFSLPLLFFLVAALVCMTTMTRLVDEQRGQIGIFLALGFSKKQIIGKYVFYAVAATLTGSIVGIPLGMALFPTVIYTTWRLMYDLPTMAIILPPEILAICVLSFVILMAAVTSIVVNKSLKEMPSQLMRPKSPKNAKKVFLENLKFLWNSLSFTGKITARNLIRYKSRFFMTVIGVAGCTALLVVGWGIKDSISDIVKIQFGQIFDYDYTISVESDHNLDEYVDILYDDYEIDYVAPFMSYSSKLYLDGEDEDPTVNVQVFDAGDANVVLGLRKTDCKTDIVLKNSGVIVSEKFAKTNNIEKGDTITIESSSGIKAEVNVSEICELYFQHYIFMSEDYYKQVFDESVHPNVIGVCTELEMDKLPDVESLENYVSTTDFSSMIEQFETMLNALDFIILVIIITSGSLALVVLINLTQVNISERLREIATLKVLGFRDNEVNAYIFKEIMLLSIIGGIVGLPLGVLAHHFIMGVINMDMVMFGNNIKFLSFFYAFVVTIVFTVLVLFFTRKSIRNIEMIESLKSVE